MFKEVYPDLQRAAEVAGQGVRKTANESIERIKERNRRENIDKYGCKDCAAAKCYISCPRYLTNAEPEIFFRWWCNTSPPNRKEKAINIPLPAPAAHGGGSKSKSNKKQKLLKDLRKYVLD